MTRTWQPLPPMAHGRRHHGVVHGVVAGGMLAVGGAREDAVLGNMPPDELFDEASGRWFALPHPMAQLRYQASAVSLPVAMAMTPPAAAGAAGP